MEPLNQPLGYKTPLTSEGCVGAGLQVHLAVAPLPRLLGVVTHLVAAVLAAAQADALLEAFGVCALVGEARVLLAKQRVHKQVYGSLVLTLHHIREVWRGKDGSD